MRFFLLLALVSLAACQNPPAPSPDDVVRKAFNLMKQAPHYTQTFSTVDDSGEFITFTVQHQKPDSFHVKMTDGPEVIVIGSQAWGNDPEKGWIPLSKPDPDPRKLSEPIQPGELQGFKYVADQPGGGLSLYSLRDGSNRIDVYVNSSTGHLHNLWYNDDSGNLHMKVDYQAAVSINNPLAK